MNSTGFLITNTMQVVVEGNTCDLANVRKKARIVIDGKPGKTRKGVLSIFADNITMEKQSMFCQPCGGVENDVGHCKTDRHKMNVTLTALKDVKEGGFKITSKDACVTMHNDTVHVMKGSEVKEVLLYVSSDRDKIEGVATPCCFNKVVMEGLETKRVISVDDSDEEDTAASSTEVRVRVTCISPREIFPVVVICQKERRFKFYININCSEQQIAAEKECKEDIAKSQWMDRVARNSIKNKIEENGLEYEKKLNEFKADIDDKNNLSADQKKNLAEQLCSTNYERKFHLLLAVEYMEQIDALEKSDLKACKVIAMGKFTFRVEVENLHVGDQKLCAGDSVKLSRDNRIYEANVLHADSTHTEMVTQSQEFMDRLRVEEKWDLHFLLNIHTYSLQARALDILGNSTCVSRLFPTEGTRSIYEEDFGKIDFVNEEVAKNSQQACAVRNILNRTSGTAPVIEIIFIEHFF